jgi:membrane protease YdiL (CAAX protease family)
MMSWACSHPIAAYVFLTLAWSWTVWSLLLLFIDRGGLMKSPPDMAYVIAAVGGLGPSLAGLTLTGLIDGSPGLAALAARCRPPPTGRWWLALLLIPAVTALTPLARWLAGAAVDGKAMLNLLGPGLTLGLAAGLMEEFGWRGFLLPRLRQKHSALRAALFVGLVWGGLWHGYADYFGIPGEGWVFLLTLLMLGPVLLTAWSLVLTVVFEHTEGNLLLAVLMHASISSSALIFGQTYETPALQLRWTAFGVVMAWCAAAALWFASRHFGAGGSVRATLKEGGRAAERSK